MSFSVLVLDILNQASGPQKLSEHTNSLDFLLVSGSGVKTLVCIMSFQQGHLEMWSLYWLYPRFAFSSAVDLRNLVINAVEGGEELGRKMTLESTCSSGKMDGLRTKIISKCLRKPMLRPRNGSHLTGHPGFLYLGHSTPRCQLLLSVTLESSFFFFFWRPF